MDHYCQKGHKTPDLGAQQTTHTQLYIYGVALGRLKIERNFSVLGKRVSKRLSHEFSRVFFFINLDLSVVHCKFKMRRIKKSRAGNALYSVFCVL